MNTSSEKLESLVKDLKNILLKLEGPVSTPHIKLEEGLKYRRRNGKTCYVAHDRKTDDPTFYEWSCSRFITVDYLTYDESPEGSMMKILLGINGRWLSYGSDNENDIVEQL